MSGLIMIDITIIPGVLLIDPIKAGRRDGEAIPDFSRGIAASSVTMPQNHGMK